MVLDGIEVFAEVVDAKSFSRAARRLGMPTSTVSAKVARLEERLGTTLIQRTTRQLSVTANGRAYYERCIRALAELSEAERALADAALEPSGLLVISVAADLAQFKLVPLIDTYLGRYPKTSVDLRITNQRVDLVAEGVDLAIRTGQMTDSTLVMRRYFPAHVGLWASRGYLDRNGTPHNARDLAQHTLLHMTRVGGPLALRDQTGGDLALTGKSRLACDDMQTLRTFVETGAGIGLLPDFIGEYPERPLVRVLPELRSDSLPISFVYAAQRFVPQTVRAFIDLAKGLETR